MEMQFRPEEDKASSLATVEETTAHRFSTEALGQRPPSDQANKAGASASCAIDKSPEIEEKSAIDLISKNLAASVFRDAAAKGAGDKIDEIFGLFPKKAGIEAAEVDINVDKKGVPDVIEIGSGGKTTVTPSMNEGAFRDLQLTPAFENALHGKNPSEPIGIKLNLGAEELSGTMKVEIIKDLRHRH